VALSGTLLAAAVLAVARRRPSAALLLAGSFVVPLAALAVPVPTDGTTVTAALVQGNVPRTGLDAFGQRAAVLDNHVRAAEQLAADVAAGTRPRPQLVIWPENSTDIDPYADAPTAAAIQRAVDAIGVPTLVGAVVTNPQDPGTVLNLGIVWAPSTTPGGGGPGESYAKRHPVPFGEYVPFRSLLTRFFTRLDRVPHDFAPGPRPGVLPLGPVRVGDVICFEVAYDGVVHDVAAADPGLLVVQTNNATYGWTEYDGVNPHEATSIDDAARAWYEGPQLNFAEWYFPQRLTIDASVALTLDIADGDWRATAYGLRA
jgi:apolipoprotein N-acyltransferase